MDNYNDLDYYNSLRQFGIISHNEMRSLNELPALPNNHAENYKLLGMSERRPGDHDKYLNCYDSLKIIYDKAMAEGECSYALDAVEAMFNKPNSLKLEDAFEWNWKEALVKIYNLALHKSDFGTAINVVKLIINNDR